jgi:hypothetical protein
MSVGYPLLTVQGDRQSDIHLTKGSHVNNTARPHLALNDGDIGNRPPSGRKSAGPGST